MSNISVEGSLPSQRTGSEICPITLDRIDGMNPNDVESTPCGHRFNREALQRWVRRGNLSCPLCRQQLNGSRTAATSLSVIELLRSHPNYDTQRVRQYEERQQAYIAAALVANSQPLQQPLSSLDLRATQQPIRIPLYLVANTQPLLYLDLDDTLSRTNEEDLQNVANTLSRMIEENLQNVANTLSRTNEERLQNVANTPSRMNQENLQNHEERAPRVQPTSRFGRFNEYIRNLYR